MDISNAGLTLLKELEGLEITSYTDEAGVWTIGYGHTRGVKPNQICTPAEAELWLYQDVSGAVDTVNRCLKDIPVTQEKFDALVCFQFNTGSLPGSTLLRYLAARNWQEAAYQFDRWIFVTKNGRKVISKGLVARRAKERALFCSH